MTTVPANPRGAAARAGSPEPLARYPLVDTPDIGEAEAHGARLLSDYRLDVRREPSFNARVNGCALGGVDLYYLDFGTTEVDIASAALVDRFGILIPTSGSMRLRYKSRDVEVVGGSSAVVISPDADFRMSWSDDFSSLVLRLHTSSFAAFAEGVVPRAQAGMLSFEPLISRPATVNGVRGAAQVL